MTSVKPTYPTIKGIDSRHWRNLVEVSWEARGEIGIVPIGFITDGASTPRILWPLFPPMDKYAIAALVHDYLYKTHPHVRKTCDKIFLALMVYLDIPKWQRNAMYRAVRIFGGRPYKKGSQAA